MIISGNILVVKHVAIYTGDMVMKLVTVLLPEAYLEGLDELVRENMYPSRSAAIRAAVRDLLKRELWTR
jgi:antitoxin ParD1/3/4